eukprot:CAMPEP_0184206222 /NCGR_PEP_ID=MMETSP0976-20121227/10480_1 /TAXON_ID=483370 /ORGANISM="non described non described, Strain CCMP2097" /LENGTH=546 /DNA_ID=CAMNT_0026510843 /DNA_START=1 /DNA_END=1637 /DNA_ORIENTATION=-
MRRAEEMRQQKKLSEKRLSAGVVLERLRSHTDEPRASAMGENDGERRAARPRRISLGSPPKQPADEIWLRRNHVPSGVPESAVLSIMQKRAADASSRLSRKATDDMRLIRDDASHYGVRPLFRSPSTALRFGFAGQDTFFGADASPPAASARGLGVSRSAPLDVVSSTLESPRPGMAKIRDTPTAKRAARIAGEARLLQQVAALRVFAATSLAYAFAQVVHRAKRLRESGAEREKAQRVICGWWRKQTTFLRFYYVSRLVGALRFNLRCTLALRIRVKRRALRRVRWLFNETETLRHFRALVRKILNAARLVQKWTRNYLACTAARTAVLRRLWEDCGQSPQKPAIKPEPISRGDSRPRAPASNTAATLGDCAWGRIDRRMDKLKGRLATVVSFYDKPNTVEVVAEPLKASTEQREASLAVLLRAIRDAHRLRWAAEATRAAYRAGSKTYSTHECAHILGLQQPSSAATALEPTDSALRRWPLMHFYLDANDTDSPRQPLRQRVRNAHTRASMLDFSTLRNRGHNLQNALGALARKRSNAQLLQLR